VYPDSWEALREQIWLTGGVLSEEVFEQACDLFMSSCSGIGQSPDSLTREWARDEFLVVVDEIGEPSLAAQAMLDHLATCRQKNPEIGRWFKPGKILVPGRPESMTLMANRWLCHLVGLRHQTVEIFIDPPDLPGFTLVQVRGVDKFEAPGSFDIPCAGHVSGLDRILDALAKELDEELNLSLEDLMGIRLTARYDTTAGRKDGPRNNEYRYLYQGQLKASGVARIRFSDGEVAALSVFALPELRLLVERFPERIASGLSGAMPFYAG